MPTNKKQNLNDVEQMNTESSDSDSSDDGPHPDAYKGNEEIQVDFEGRSPIDSHADGIRQLLLQLFLKAHIDAAEMADLIIGQNYIGSVVVQSEPDDVEDDDDDDDDEMYDSNMIFGITSVINLTSKKEINCVKQLKSYLLEKSKNTTDDIKDQLKNILENDNRSVGFLINERFINIPAQISVPLLENLYKEIKRANEKKMNYDFDYYLMIIKFYRKEAKKNKPSEDIYSNQEEEAMCKNTILSFEYSVQSEADSGMTGNWLENDSNLIPYRKVIVFEANKLPQIITSVKDFIEE